MSKLKINRNIPSEYIILALGWMFWAISQGLLRIENSQKDDTLLIIGIVFVQAFNFFIANLLTIKCFEKILLKVKSTRQKYLLSILVVVLIALAFVFVNISFYNYANGKSKILTNFTKYLANGFEKIIYVSGFSPMFFFIQNLKEYRKQKTILEQAQQTAREAQLQMLQQQLNPHFLFNTLNSLRCLIAIDTDRARSMVTDLSEFLRVTLSSYKSVRNTINDEVSLVEYYLKIQKIRFEEELRYIIDIQHEVSDFTIPKFVFQPLVENALKYGMITSAMPLTLTVRAERTNQAVLIRISNTGKLVDSVKEKHSNHGIANTRARLELMFPGKANLYLKETGGSVTAEIVIQT